MMRLDVGKVALKVEARGGEVLLAVAGNNTCHSGRAAMTTGEARVLIAALQAAIERADEEKAKINQKTC